MARLEYRSVVVEAGGRPIAGPASFSVESREIVMVVGPNGAGKTTLLRAAAGLARVSRGEVIVEGTPVYVPQSDMLLPWMTLEENIALPLIVSGIRREEAIARARSIASTLGLTSHLGKLPREASGGTRRKAAVARGLVKGADILLLDEPFTGVDAASLGAILSTLETLRRQGIATVIVTHQIHLVAAIADRAVVLYPPPVGVAKIIDLAGLDRAQRYSAAESIVSLLAKAAL